MFQRGAKRIEMIGAKLGTGAARGLGGGRGGERLGYWPRRDGVAGVGLSWLNSTKRSYDM